MQKIVVYYIGVGVVACTIIFIGHFDSLGRTLPGFAIATSLAGFITGFGLMIPYACKISKYEITNSDKK